MTEPVFHIRNFIDAEKCTAIIEAFQINRHFGRQFSTRDELPGVHVRSAIQATRLDALKAMQDHFQEPFLQIEFTVLTEMRPGDEHKLHADNVRSDGTPNHTPYRSHTCMIYLNSWYTDFKGGMIDFPDEGKIYHPEPGLFVGFKGNVFHRVPAVTDGKRYAMAMWYSLEPVHIERW